MSGMCVSDRQKEKPHWISVTYRNYNQCCFSGSTDSQKCLQNRPDMAGGGAISPGLARPWYVSVTSGLCLHEEERPRPDWVEETYMRYEQCCKESSNRSLCMKARPSNQFGTLAPTPTPPATYFVDPTTGMCTSDLEQPIVSMCNICLRR